MSNVRVLTVGPDECDLRLDRWFHRHFPELPHGRLEKLLRTGQVRVDGRRAQSSLRLAAGQAIRVPPLSAARAAEAAQRRAAPTRDRVSRKDAEQLVAAVLYKDDDMLAINKPAGLAVQGGSGLTRHLDAMLEALRFDADERPRLVHRLDRDTSGLLLLARNARAAARLAEAFRRKTCQKTYWAVVVGVPKPQAGRIDLPLAKRPLADGDERVQADEAGDHAITDYRVIDRAGNMFAWLELNPITGRTHQLRVHCKALGTPILGDGKYGGATARPDGGLARGLHLHARRIALPAKGGQFIVIEAPLPDHMTKTFQALGFRA